ncbi:MAG: putative collagen-binding domain-containing protein, partial [Candidatus Acidiferrales bacterium]
TINLANFSQPVTAAWYDPSSGTFSTIAGSPFSNSGSQVFTPSGNNSDGNTDWVLVLEVHPTF